MGGWTGVGVGGWVICAALGSFAFIISAAPFEGWLMETSTLDFSTWLKEAPTPPVSLADRGRYCKDCHRPPGLSCLLARSAQ